MQKVIAKTWKYLSIHKWTEFEKVELELIRESVLSEMCDKQVSSSIPCLEITPLKSQQPIHRKLLQMWVWIDIKCVTDKKTWLLFFDKRIMRLVWKTPPHKSTDILLKTVANMLTSAWITFSWIETVLKLNEFSRRLEGISLNRSLGIMIRTRCKRWTRKHVNIYQHTNERNQKSNLEKVEWDLTRKEQHVCVQMNLEHHRLNWNRSETQ